MNGKVATVIEYDSSKERYMVTVEGGVGGKSIRHENLVLGTLPEISSLPTVGGGAAAAAEEAAVREKADEGYPKEPLCTVYEKLGFNKLLVVQTAKDTKKLLKRLPMVFPWAAQNAAKNTSPVASKREFEENWAAFSCGIFSQWSTEDFNNVLVAGGSILACLLPKPAHFSRLRPGAHSEQWIDFNFANFDGSLMGSDQPSRTLEQYMQETQ